MIRLQIKEALDRCFEDGIVHKKWSDAVRGKYTVEIPKREGQGDFSTNIAMVLAGSEKKNPREIAQVIAEEIIRFTDIVDKVEIAGPGFVNFTVSHNVWQNVIHDIVRDGEKYGTGSEGNNRKVLVEFVIDCLTPFAETKENVLKGIALLQS